MNGKFLEKNSNKLDIGSGTKYQRIKYLCPVSGFKNSRKFNKISKETKLLTPKPPPLTSNPSDYTPDMFHLADYEDEKQAAKE